tara:strand:+ start:57807 stop:58946 length:1140 start_codon:yes stop_codon:yes gene_type:complete
MRIVRVLVERGFDVELIYGGEQLPNFDHHGARVHFLPSLTSSKGDFSKLVTGDGSVATDEYRHIRRGRILAILAESEPDIIVTEAFPFGRRQMHFELLPFMEAAVSMEKRPKIFASVRDILQEGNKPSKDRQTVDLLDRYFDGVLVHGDRHLISLDKTFPYTEEISGKIYYTGIVTPQTTTPQTTTPQTVPTHADKGTPIADRHFEVVVSAGGGLLGRELVLAAAEAKAGSSLDDAHWCILTGPYMDEKDRQQLSRPGIAVREFIPDLHLVLATARLSISLAGYNTVADIMAAGCRAIMAPQWNDKETEQLRRAELLAARGLVEMLSHEAKTAIAVRTAIDRVMAKPSPDWSSIQTNGAAVTADILQGAFDGDDLKPFQ